MVSDVVVDAALELGPLDHRGHLASSAAATGAISRAQMRQAAACHGHQRGAQRLGDLVDRLADEAFNQQSARGLGGNASGAEIEKQILVDLRRGRAYAHTPRRRR